MLNGAASRSGPAMTNPPRLTHSDRGWLVVAALVVTAAAFFRHSPSGLTEALFGQSLTEMSDSGDWLIPTVGGAAWSDASPLVQWIAGALLPLSGDNPILAIRLSGLLGLVLASLFTADLAAQCGGRRLGLFAGGILSTTFGLAGDIVAGGNFIWLAASGTAVLRLLTAIESESRHTYSRAALPFQRHSPFSVRSHQFLSLFLVVTCVAIGTDLLSVIAMLFVPLAGWLAFRGLAAARKYAWVWGFLGASALTAGWLIAINSHAAGIEYVLQRLQLGTVAEWSLQSQLIETLSYTLPWGLLIPIGLWVTRHEALGDANSRERLICCYALLCPIAVLVLRPQHTGDCLAAAGAWSVLAAIGLDAFIRHVTLRLNLVDARPLRTGLRRAAIGTAAMMAAVQVQSNASIECDIDVREIAAQIRGNATAGDVVSFSQEDGKPQDQLLIALRSAANQEVTIQQPRSNNVRIAAEAATRN